MTSEPDARETAAPSRSTAQSQAEGHTDQVGAARREEGRPRRLTGSTLKEILGRLEAMDVVNRGMMFAAVLLLCLVPFLIIVDALAGHSAATGMIKHFGLNQAAATDVAQVFTSPSSTSGSITGLSWAFFILGGVAAATTLQQLYEAEFGISSRGLRDTWRRLFWLGSLIGVLALGGWLGPWLHKVAGPVLLAVMALGVLIGFWWFTMWFLLAGTLGWRQLFPSALATGLCWLGMSLVFRWTLSGTITEDYKKYGAIGVVFALMSFLIAVGVVVILGAAVGVMWTGRKRDQQSP